MVAKHPKEEINAEIQSQVEKLESQLRSNQDILTLLKTSRSLNLVGFSQYLEALSRTIPHNAWLTEFTISEAGEHVALYGKAYDSHTVLSFVDSLNANKLFIELGLHFRLVKVKKAVNQEESGSTAQQSLYDFEVTTSDGNEEAG